jgi:hypothetical protein
MSLLGAEGDETKFNVTVDKIFIITAEIDCTKMKNPPATHLFKCASNVS